MPTSASRDACVTRALDLLAPPGTVRTLLSVRLTEHPTEVQNSLREALGDPVDGMDLGEVAWQRERLEQGGLLRTAPAGLEATPPAKELGLVFLAASSWAARYRPETGAAQHIAVTVEEVLLLGAHPLTAPVLDQLRDGPATQEDLARPMTASARAQLPDQLAVLVEQELVVRLPDGALRTTPAGTALAGVQDHLAAWYSESLGASRSQAAATRSLPAGSSLSQTPPPRSGNPVERPGLRL
ncbi:hypothetical protein [Kitasatospora sp. HPMI-4]|uniref:hypothetical protein n=1 Tax=Kitasatospora sp. HPMI-4 TaxID=3448443 RepID=UPI003F1B39BF